MSNAQLTPEQSEIHRQRVLRLEERIENLKQLGHVYLLFMLNCVLSAVLFASLPVSHYIRVMLWGLLGTYTIIGAIGWLRTDRERRALEERYTILLFKRD